MLTSLPPWSHVGTLLLGVLSYPPRMSFCLSAQLLLINPHPHSREAPFHQGNRPVRMDWSTRSVVDLMDRMRISAGTLSPTVERGEKEDQLRKRFASFLRKAQCLSNCFPASFGSLGGHPAGCLPLGLRQALSTCSCRSRSISLLTPFPVFLAESFSSHRAMSPVRGGTGVLPGT